MMLALVDFATGYWQNSPIRKQQIGPFGEIYSETGPVEVKSRHELGMHLSGIFVRQCQQCNLLSEVHTMQKQMCDLAALYVPLDSVN